jgi:hypothetical protein
MIRIHFIFYPQPYTIGWASYKFKEDLEVANKSRLQCLSSIIAGWMGGLFSGFENRDCY